MSIRRIVCIAASAAVLVLAPSAAMAYDAPGYSSTVSDPTPAVGSPVTVTVNSPNANALILLTVTCDLSIPDSRILVAGTKSLAKTANANGVAVYTVTLSAPGTYTLTATNEAGATVSTQTLTVVAVGTTTTSTTGTQLTDTGFNGLGLAVGAVALMLVGAVGVVFARRRESGQDPSRESARSDG